MESKKLNEVATVGQVNSDQFVILTDGTGGTTKVSLAALKSSLLAGVDLNAISDGVFIMWHGNSDDYPRMVKPEKWTSYQSSGEIAEGVVLVEGGKILVVAPTESEQSLTWSSAAVEGGGVMTWDREKVLNDWAGRANTTAQIAHPECNTESYAPGFCNAYSRTNNNGKGLTAGRWWLPSMGELMAIYANMRKINYALSFINGATPLQESWYWSSTEGSATGAWHLYLNSGGAYGNAKASGKYRVRAVSAFLN